MVKIGEPCDSEIDACQTIKLLVALKQVLIIFKTRVLLEMLLHA